MNITWLGQGGFLFESDGKRLVIDPYLTDVLAEKGFARSFTTPMKPEELHADVIVCTHDHGDHFDPDTVLPAKEAYPDTAVVGPLSVVKHGADLGLSVELISPEKEAVELGPFTLTAVPAHHSDPESIGLLIDVDSYKIYITADTTFEESLVQNVQDHGPIDLLITCINGKLGNMSASEALKVSKGINPGLTVPMHYGMFPNNTVDPDVFLAATREAGVNAHALQVGKQYQLSDLLEEQLNPVSFKGVVPPLVTPLNNDETLDKESLCKLIEKLASAGCSALFLCGTAGVGPALTDRIYMEVLKTAIKAVSNDIPLLAGVMEPSTTRAIHRLRLAEKAGCEFAVLSVPYFFSPRTEREIWIHFRECARAVSMNIIAYNLPQYTHCNIPSELLVSLYKRGMIGGVKESSGDEKYFETLCQQAALEGLPVFQGNRPVMARLAELDASGIVPVHANVAPELLVEAWNTRDTISQDNGELQDRVDTLWNELVNGYDFLSGTLTKLSEEGIGTGRLPYPWTN